LIGYENIDTICFSIFFVALIWPLPRFCVDNNLWDNSSFFVLDFNRPTNQMNRTISFLQLQLLLDLNDFFYKMHCYRPIVMSCTESFTDLGKLNFRWWFGFRLEPIFNTAPAASKNKASFKRGQIDSKISNSVVNLNTWRTLYQFGFMYYYYYLST